MLGAMRTIDHLIDEFLRELWEEEPVWAGSLGIDGYDDRLDEHSTAAYERRHAREDRWLARFAAEPDDGLSLDERIDRDLIVANLRGSVVMREWAAWRRNPAVYIHPGLNGAFTLFLHRLRPDDELAHAAAARLKQVPAVLEDGRRNLDPTLTPPLFVERALAECRGAVTYCRDLVAEHVGDGPARALLAEAGELAASAYEDFGAFLLDLQERASGDYAIGEERYSAILEQQELLGYGAREMHERGRAAFDEIAEDMRQRARDLRGTDDWGSVIEELNADHPPTPQEMLAAYTSWTERARAFCRERRLVTLPDGEECLIEPSPVFQRATIAVAFYQEPPAFKPSLTGHFFVPYPPDGATRSEIDQRLASNSYHAIPGVSVHEAYPGHHWHLVATQGNPRRVRQVLGSSYFTEGWALYTEAMMREEGLFDDPRHQLCVSEARLFRAARIIVDTALHLGTMSFDDGVAFMRDRMHFPEASAIAEVGRYCTWPTQAASYLTGALEIERMRARWFAEQRGDLRTFHDRLAGSGMLPIGLAERALFDAPAA